MTDHFDEVRRRARQARLKPKAPPRPRASTDGRQAFRDGRRLDENPHPRHDPEHETWRQAWLDAREDVT